MRPLLDLLDRLALRFAVGLILIESIGAASSLRADQTEDSLDQILLAGDSMDLLKYADRYKTPADQQIIFKRLKGKIDTGQAADRFILAMIAPMKLGAIRHVKLVPNRRLGDAVLVQSVAPSNSCPLFGAIPFEKRYSIHGFGLALEELRTTSLIIAPADRARATNASQDSRSCILINATMRKHIAATPLRQAAAVVYRRFGSIRLNMRDSAAEFSAFSYL